ncbi:hypothetical protein BASA60_007582 [Batrachochytrium salamandrivorans]|nr:hypothetical protein BASA60_007582 [Batrachochytrium salamandrivorans]
MRFTVPALIALLATVSSVTARPVFGLNSGAQLEKGNPPSNTLYKNNRSTESVLRLKVSPAVPRPAQRVFSKEANAAKLKVWRDANVKHRQYTKRLLGMIPDITTTSDNEDQLRNMALSKKIACALKRRHVRLNAYSKKLKNSTKRLVHRNSLAHQLDMMINRTRRYTVQAILHARKTCQDTTDSRPEEETKLFGIYSTRSWKSISKRRVVAVGDLHGDFEMSVETLQVAKIINDDLEWIAGNTILVQTGDVVDRGHDTIELYDLLRDLTDQAKKHGGRLIQLLGNHEVMNMAEDLRYVSKEDIASYGGLDVRLKAFSKHGDIGEYLRTLGIAAKVDDTVFFHAGGLNWGIDVLNTLARQELVDQDAKYISKSEIFVRNGPLWYRGFALRKDNAFCDAKRMVIGHTPTEDGMIDDRCNGLVYIIDVGISRSIRGRIAALEIVGKPCHSVVSTIPCLTCQILNASILVVAMSCLWI